MTSVCCDSRDTLAITYGADTFVDAAAMDTNRYECSGGVPGLGGTIAAPLVLPLAPTLVPQALLPSFQRWAIQLLSVTQVVVLTTF